MHILFLLLLSCVQVSTWKEIISKITFTLGDGLGQQRTKMLEVQKGNFQKWFLLCSFWHHACMSRFTLCCHIKIPFLLSWRCSACWCLLRLHRRWRLASARREHTTWRKRTMQPQRWHASSHVTWTHNLRLGNHRRKLNRQNTECKTDTRCVGTHASAEKYDGTS